MAYSITNSCRKKPTVPRVRWATVVTRNVPTLWASSPILAVTWSLYGITYSAIGRVSSHRSIWSGRVNCRCTQGPADCVIWTASAATMPVKADRGSTMPSRTMRIVTIAARGGLFVRPTRRVNRP